MIRSFLTWCLLMLSIGKLGHGGEQYYIELTRDDYYTAGGEPDGTWLTNGLTEFGIRSGDKVDADQLTLLVQGFAPDGSGRKLVQNAGSEKRWVGLDFTFSAPKSVSIAWALAGPEDRRRIERCLHQAVDEALAVFERDFVRCARGHAGKVRVPGKMVVARFLHGTSREVGDPQLHVHCLWLNVAQRPDRTYGAVRPFPFKQNKRFLGLVEIVHFRAALERELGFATEDDRFTFRLADIPKALEKPLSQRSCAIREAMRKRGLSGAKAAEWAALRTRKSKVHLPRAVVFERAREVALGLGFTQEKVDALFCGRPVPPAASLASTPKAREGARSPESTRCSAHPISRPELRKEDPVLRLAASLIAKPNSDSPAAVLARKARRHASAALRKPRKRPRGRLLKQNPSLSPDQQAAVTSLLAAPGRLALLTGGAAVGKTQTLAGAASALEEAGYEVFLVSTTRLGKRMLEDRTGSEAMTLRTLERRVARGLLPRAVHHARQLAREARGKPGYGPLTLSHHSAIVLDGANIIYERADVERVLNLADRAGARLVLAGRTLSSSPFSKLAATLTDERSAAAHSSSVVYLDALDVDPKEVRPSIREQVRERLTTHANAPEPELTPCQDTARSVNQREAAAHNPRTLQHARHGKRRFRPGHRIVLTVDAPHLGVRGGDTATIQRIEARPKLLGGEVLVCRLDRLQRKGLVIRPLRVRIPLNDYKFVDFAYAFSRTAAESTSPEQSLRARLGLSQSPNAFHPDLGPQA